MWPHCHALLPGSPRRLDCPPAPPVPVCHTRGEIACRFRAWCRQCCQDACAGSPRCICLSPYPAVGVALLPALAHASFPLLPSLAPHALVARLMEGVPSHPCPRLYSPSTPSLLMGTPEVSSSQGNYSTPGVLMPCGNSTPPPTPWWSPLWFSATPEALCPPLSVYHPRGLAGRVFLLAGDPRHFPSSRPMAASRFCCSLALGGGVGVGALAGRCTPWFIVRAASH